MSVTAMAVAWLRATGSPGAKLVLMALADHANDDGVCWPGQDTIARKAEMSTRAVRSNLARLVELGFVRVEERRRGDGSMASNLYVLDMTLGPSAKTSGGPPEAGRSTHRKPASGHEPPIGTVNSASSKKKQILPLDEEPVGFLEWLGHHATVGAQLNLSLSVPRHGTSYRSSLARTFTTLTRVEGYTLEEMKLASEGVLSDDYMRLHGHVKPDNVLRKEKIGGRIDQGRRWREARETGTDAKYAHLDGA